VRVNKAAFQVLTSPSPSSPPTRGGEMGLFTRLSILIIHGREDKGVPLDRSQKLNDLWKGSKLVVFDKAGHTPHEEYPEKFNKLALDFLSE